MSGRRDRLLRWVAATDSTFELIRHTAGRMLAGKCIHCRRRIVVGLDAATQTSATLEHIVPKSHGGTDALDNLALACPRCNHGKGTRLDHRPLNDPTLQEVVATLQERRRERWRQPPEEFGLGPKPVNITLTSAKNAP